MPALALAFLLTAVLIVIAVALLFEHFFGE